MLHVIGVSPLISELPFLVFDESLSEHFLRENDSPDNFLIGTEWAIETVIASALSKGLKQSLFLGLQTVWDLLYNYNNSHFFFKVAGLSVRTFRILVCHWIDTSKRYTQ